MSAKHYIPFAAAALALSATVCAQPPQGGRGGPQPEFMRQAQQATMDVWQASVRAGDGLLASAASGEMSGQEDTRQKRQ